MLQNYLKIAIRNLFTNKTYSLVNIFGLAIGLACFIIITTYIKNELSYDTFHENADRIYRPYGVHERPGIGVQRNAVTPGPLGPALANDFPQVVSAARVRPMFTVFCKVGEKGFYEQNGAYADDSIFEIFSIPLIRGDAETILQNPNSLVINEDLARKYFGDQDPRGQTISVHRSAGVDDYVVSGVMRNYPQNSHLRFSMLASLATLEHRVSYVKSWNSNSLATYVLLQQGVSATELEKQFPEFLTRHTSQSSGTNIELHLQPLRDIHLKSDHLVYETYNNNEGSIETVYLFSAIAVLVLLIACINFMNLSTARSAKRAKEVGLRKVVGAERWQLIRQFLGESIIITFLALLLSVGLVQLVSPFIETVLEDRLIFDYSRSWAFYLQLLAIATVTGIIAGSYPAFFLSSYRPVETLKPTKTTTVRGGSAFLRKILVVAQFVITIALLICTGVIWEQMDFVRNKQLGYNKDHVVYLPLRSHEVLHNVPLLKNDLREHPGIVAVAASAGLRGAAGSNGVMNVAGTNRQVQLMMRHSFVDFDYIETMEMEIVRGRSFSKEFAADTLNSVVINEAAVRKLGWDDPIGKEFENLGGGRDFSVIGVVKDYHFFSLHTEIEPLIMWLAPSRVNYLVIRVAPTDIEDDLAFIKATWAKHVPGLPFEYDFLDAHFARLYRTDQNTGRLFGAFSSVAIIIACLGLFGLASFTAEQKTKEIGIRKVLGASVGSIMTLLSLEFAKWVAISSVIAFPVAFLTTRDWLNNFAYRTAIEPHIFVFASILALAIALITVGTQAVKAAVANPIHALRYE